MPTMSWFTAIVVFALIWWIALFVVLPIGVRPDPDGDPEAGGWRGTPRNPRLGLRLLATTVLAGVIWLAIWGVIESGWLSFRDGVFAVRFD
jgi:predicted secreted protein